MRKILCLFLILNFVTACSTTSKKNIIQLDETSTSYACQNPKFTMGYEGIKGQMYEYMIGQEHEIERSCISTYAPFGYFRELKRGGRGGTIAYIWVSICTVGVLPLVDMIAGWDNSTECQDKEIRKGKRIQERLAAKGNFSGQIYVVKLDQPDWVREKKIDDNFNDIIVPIDDSFSEYAIEIKGRYRSENTECSIKTQTIIKP